MNQLADSFILRQALPKRSRHALSMVTTMSSLALAQMQTSKTSLRTYRLKCHLNGQFFDLNQACTADEVALSRVVNEPVAFVRRYLRRAVLKNRMEIIGQEIWPKIGTRSRSSSVVLQGRAVDPRAGLGIWFSNGVSFHWICGRFCSACVKACPWGDPHPGVYPARAVGGQNPRSAISTDCARFGLSIGVVQEHVIHCDRRLGGVAAAATCPRGPQR